MTIVAAIAEGGEVFMAADTETNYAGTAVHRAQKILRVPVGSEWALVSASGAGGLLALVRRRLKLMPPVEGESLQEWAEEIGVSISELAHTVSPPLTVSNQDNTRLDGALLIGFRGRLFYVFTHMAVEVADGVAAIGSGTDVALGAMQMARQMGAPPERTVRAAVSWACVYAPGCSVDERGPLTERLKATS